MKHTDIQDMWDIDSAIDPNNIVVENARTGKLHSKYVRLYGQENAKLKEMKVYFENLRAEKSDFYMKGSDEVWRAKGWEDRPEGRILKQDLGRVLPQDKHLVEALLKIAQQEAKVDTLVEIMKHIKERSWLLKNITAEKKYLAGE